MGGLGLEQDFFVFFDCCDFENISDEIELFVDCVSGWLDLMGQVMDLYLIICVCVGFYFWCFVGFGQYDDCMEVVVVVVWIVVSDGRGVVFMFLVMGGVGGL